MSSLNYILPTDLSKATDQELINALGMQISETIKKRKWGNRAEGDEEVKKAQEIQEELERRLGRKLSSR